jgi:glycosyltransferase involved in cell wall biosynthesis
MTQIVGSVLVRNEDAFVERSIRNVAGFCDRIHAVDHVSTDRTWEILERLAAELDHLEVERSRNSATAHRLLAPYAGTATWVFGVDGDELYDPAGLQRLRTALLAGEHADVFRLKAHVLNCDELDEHTAGGWLAPPSRPITKLFNFGAVESWKESPDPLQAGDVVFKAGQHWESRRDLADSTSWEDDPLRCLHVCFLPRSSADDGDARANLDESGAYDRGPFGALKRLVRPRRNASWKHDWYARGEHVTVDAAPFLGR